MVWLGLVVCIVHSSAPFGGPLGALTGKFSDLFYSDPRRLSAVVAMLLGAGRGHRALRPGERGVRGIRSLVGRTAPGALRSGTARPPRC